MTEKRFYVDKNGDFRDTKTGNIIVDFGYSFNGMDCKMILDLLNKLNDECEFLEIENESLEDGATKYAELYHKSLKENEELKQQLKTRVIVNKQYEELQRLKKENEQLKKVLGAILLEVRRDISNTNQTGEIKVFINPNSFDLISEVLKKYGALKGWYE